MHHLGLTLYNMLQERTVYMSWNLSHPMNCASGGRRGGGGQAPTRPPQNSRTISLAGKRYAQIKLRTRKKPKTFVSGPPNAAPTPGVPHPRATGNEANIQYDTHHEKSPRNQLAMLMRHQSVSLYAKCKILNGEPVGVVAPYFARLSIKAAQRTQWELVFV